MEMEMEVEMETKLEEITNTYEILGEDIEANEAEQ